MFERRKIIRFKPGLSISIGRRRVLSARERRRLTARVQAYEEHEGLDKALSALWEQQKSIGFVLGEPTVGENLTDETKFLQKKIGPYWLIHSPARAKRGDTDFLKEVGILADRLHVYEKPDEEPDSDCYVHFPGNRHGFSKLCFLCSAQGANPNEILVSVELSGTEFIYGANFATLGRCHFTVWTRTPILQRYWSPDSLVWLAEHGRRLQSAEYATIFNGLGAGNSIRHFHYQTFRESVPILKADEIPGSRSSSGIVRLKWPMPAYRITVSAHADPAIALSPMDALIRSWLATKRGVPSFNLIHGSGLGGTAQFVFVPRVVSGKKRRPPGISNDFAGCEVGGRINIESRKEWEFVKDQPESFVIALLESVAPPLAMIKKLEAHI